MFKFFKTLLRAGDPAEATHRAYSKPQPSVCAEQLVESGAIYEGKVAYVGPKFAKIESDNFLAFMPIGEMSAHRINSASEVLEAGQIIKFVTLEPSTKVPGEWIVSLSALAEAEKRLHLSQLTGGQRISAEVMTLLDKGAVLHADGAELFAPLAELSWASINHPAEAVSLGQVVEVEVINISIPEWNPKWRQVRSKATVSIRKCLARPSPKFIGMAFSAIPFRLAAHSRRPPNLDPVVIHVLAELIDGHTLNDIEKRTRLPAITISAILELLTSEGYMSEGVPTPRARDLIEAEMLAHRINEANFGGFACNVAEHEVRIMDRNGRVPDPPYPADSVIPIYPPSWPQPAFDPRADKQFFRLTGESIPDAVMKMLLNEEEQSLVTVLQNDQRLHLSLRPNGPRQPMFTYVSEHWIYSGLWSAFEPLGMRKPYRPEPDGSGAALLLLVQLHTFDADNRPLEPIFLEPYSDTLWQKRNANLMRFREQRGTAFPPIPTVPLDGLRLVDGTVAMRLDAAGWCSVQIKGPR